MRAEAETSDVDQAAAVGAREALLTPELLRTLQRRSDARGLARLAGHLAAMVGTGALYSYAGATGWAAPFRALSLIAYGFTLVTMFAAMHEAIHRTAFKSRWLNDGVGWLAGLLSFYNSTFYRHYHGWHHRFTQIRGRDPELDDLKPTNLRTYLIELSGLFWWVGKVRTYVALARNDLRGFPFLTTTNGPAVVRSVRAQLLVYAAAIVASFLLGRPWFVTHWLLPVALAQPILRAILLAEHTGCSEDDDPLRNTRTTHTIAPVRFLMWDMPYHAEHHRYPALPFFALGQAHAVMGPRLAHVAHVGYLGVHRALLRRLLAPASGQPARDDAA